MNSSCALVVSLSFLAADVASAQCSQWASYNPRLGFSDRIINLEAWPSEATPNRYVAVGPFREHNGVGCNGVAVNDGGTWQALGEGFDDTVNDAAILNGELIVAGKFTASGETPLSRVARWDGDSWEALGPGLNNAVIDLEVFQNTLYAIGSFEIGPSPVNGFIARWTGSAWEGLGTGLNGSPGALGVHDGKLIVVGAFSSVDGIAASRAAAWNGTSWSALPTGLPGGAGALISYGGSLYAGGYATSVGGRYVYRLDGGAWTSLGTGLTCWPRKFFVHEGAVCVAGTTSPANPLDPESIRRWSGSQWVAAFDQEPNAIWDAIVTGGPSGDAVVVAGEFVGGLMTWDGSRWRSERDWFDGPIRNMVVHKGDLYVAGEFTTAPGGRAMGIARFDGVSFTPVGSGFSGWPRAMYSDGEMLYVGGDNGDLELASGRCRLASWDGDTWSMHGHSVNVRAVAIYEGSIYIAGQWFASFGVSHPVARREGETWVPLGDIQPRTNATAMVVWNGLLVVGGPFTSVDGQPVDQVIAWDGVEWRRLDTNRPGGISSLAVHDGELYGAFFTGVEWGGSIARWTGSEWETEWTVGAGPLRVADGRLMSSVRVRYPLFSYTTYFIERTASGWLPIVPMDGFVDSSSGSAICMPFRNEVVYNAPPGTSDTSTAPYFSRVSTTGVPFIVSQPASVAAACPRADVVFEAVPASGYDVFPVWHRDGVPLVDGVGPDGSEVIGAETLTLTILNAGPGAEGAYACEISTECGSVWTEAATLSVCIANYNCDEETDILDLLDFIEDFAACEQAPAPCGAFGEADINGDTLVDILDFLDFIGSIDAGCG